MSKLPFKYQMIEKAITRQYEPIQNFVSWKAHVGTSAETLTHRIVKLKEHSNKEFDEAARRAMKLAAFDTGAIESLYDTDRGFTYAVAAQTSAIRFVSDRRDPDTARYFQDQMNAYEAVLDLATSDAHFSEAWIRELHSIICASQESHTVVVNEILHDQDFLKGVYKTTENHVLKSDGIEHQYCPATNVSAEMHRLVTETESPEFLNSPCHLQAAYVHHCFTVIHPFADGNGRVARALASVFTYRKYSLPFVMFADQRPQYFAALEAADESKTGEFAVFVFERIRDAVDIVEQNIQTSKSPDLNTIVSELKTNLNLEQAISIAEVNQKVDLFSKFCTTALARKIKESESQLGGGTKIATGTKQSRQKHMTPELGYRLAEVPKFVMLSVQIVQNPKPRPVEFLFDIVIPNSVSIDSHFQLFRVTPTKQVEPAFYLRTDELISKPSQLTEYKLDQWAERTLAQALETTMQNMPNGPV